eukprot:jgi/Hompol1/6601/HPOL_001398-RA
MWKHPDDVSPKKEPFLNFLIGMDRESPLTMPYASVVATTKAEVVTIPRLDFCRIAPNTVVYSMLSNPSMQRTPIEQLQSIFMQQQNWQTYRKHVLGEVASKRK